MDSKTERFVAGSKKRHGEKYDYTYTRYRDPDTPVEIGCPKHGPFFQTLDEHWQGCPTCLVRSLDSACIEETGAGVWHFERSLHRPKSSRKSRYAGEYSLYILHSEERISKVGMSKEVDKRLADIQKASPFSVDRYWHKPIGCYSQTIDIEKWMHLKLRGHRAKLKGFDGATEWFEVHPDRAHDIYLEAEKIFPTGA